MVLLHLSFTLDRLGFFQTKAHIDRQLPTDFIAVMIVYILAINTSGESSLATSCVSIMK